MSSDAEENMNAFKWPELESNPDIFSNFMHKLGLPETWTFEDLISMDNDSVEVASAMREPIIGVIACIKSERFDEPEAQEGYEPYEHVDLEPAFEG